MKMDQVKRTAFYIMFTDSDPNFAFYFDEESMSWREKKQ